MTYTGYVTEGLHAGLGAVAPIEISRNSIMSSDTYVYISEDESGNILINRNAVDHIEMIHSNYNKYTDRDGFLVKEYPDKVKITVSNPRKTGESNFYPIFKVDVEIEALPNEEEE